MRGYFDNQRIYFDITISGVFAKNKKTVKAQLDTGFDGYLTLPYTDAFPLGLVLVGTTAYTIADGSTMYNFVCLGNAHIDTEDMPITIDIQPKGSILAGMKLLSHVGKTLAIDFAKQTVRFSKILL